MPDQNLLRSLPSVDALLRKRLIERVAHEVDVASLGDPRATNPSTELEAAEIRTGLYKALSTLTAHERLLISLKFDQEASFREIGELLGLPSRFHSHRQLRKVLQKLRKYLEEGGFDGP